jgi:hypothetical protein
LGVCFLGRAGATTLVLAVFLFIFAPREIPILSCLGVLPLASSGRPLALSSDLPGEHRCSQRSRSTLEVRGSSHSDACHKAR